MTLRGPIDEWMPIELERHRWGKADTPLDGRVQALRISLREECALWT
jgi:hypothetical protein